MSHKTVKIHPRVRPGCVPEKNTVINQEKSHKTVIFTGSAVALQCRKAHVRTQWERANFDPNDIKIPEIFQIFELDVCDYVPEIYTRANVHFNPFSGGFSPDR